jgi:hypothetical protein
MKGTILGFGAALGAIIGDDEQRYAFTSEDWKGAALPAAGSRVDFVPEGSAAKGIYPLVETVQARPSKIAGGPAFAGGLNKLQESFSEAVKGDLAQKAIAVAHRRPQVVLALIILLASIFLTWNHLNLGGMAGAEPDASLLSFPSQASAVASAIALSTKATQPAMDMIAGLGGQEVAQGLRSRQARLDRLASFLKFSYLGWLIPAGALFLLYSEYRNIRSPRLELAVGCVAILFFCFYYWGISKFASALAAGTGSDGLFGGGLSSAMSDAIKSQMATGFGAWLIAAAGAGLVLTALGILRQTPGLENFAIQRKTEPA